MKVARTLGVIFQGLVLGVLLFLATAKLVAAASGARVFQYQGF